MSVFLCEHLCQSALGGLAYILIYTRTHLHAYLVTNTYSLMRAVSTTYHTQSICRPILWHNYKTKQTNRHTSDSRNPTHTNKHRQISQILTGVCSRFQGVRRCQRGLSECCHSPSSCQGWLNDMPVLLTLFVPQRESLSFFIIEV